MNFEILVFVWLTQEYNTNTKPSIGPEEMITVIFNLFPKLERSSRGGGIPRFENAGSAPRLIPCLTAQPQHIFVWILVKHLVFTRSRHLSKKSIGKRKILVNVNAWKLIVPCISCDIESKNGTGVFKFSMPLFWCITGCLEVKSLCMSRKDLVASPTHSTLALYIFSAAVDS